MRAVVGASVIVSALIDEGVTGRWARGELNAFTIAAPQLITVESTHSLRRAQLLGSISVDVASLAYADLLDFPLELYPFRPFAERI